MLREGGFADVAPAADPEPVDDRAEGREPRHAHRVEELPPRHVEVLAQRIAEGRTGFREFGADDLLDHHHAGAAGGAGLGAGLDARDIRAALVVDGVTDRPGGDAVA